MRIQRRTSASVTSLRGGGGSGNPGKSTLVQRRASVQRKAEAAPADPAVVTPAAEAGVSGGGGAVPFRDQMESGFGVSF